MNDQYFKSCSSLPSTETDVQLCKMLEDVSHTIYCSILSDTE